MNGIAWQQLLVHCTAQLGLVRALPRLPIRIPTFILRQVELFRPHPYMTQDIDSESVRVALCEIFEIHGSKSNMVSYSFVILLGDFIHTAGYVCMVSWDTKYVRPAILSLSSHFLRNQIRILSLCFFYSVLPLSYCYIHDCIPFVRECEGMCKQKPNNKHDLILLHKGGLDYWLQVFEVVGWAWSDQPGLVGGVVSYSELVSCAWK